MTIRAKFILPIMLLTILVGGLLYKASSAKAQESFSVGSMIGKLSERFGLKEADVQTFFDQEQETRYEQMLSLAVTAGKITDAQKQLLIGKHKELVGWANQNQISLRYLVGGGPGMGRGMNVDWNR